jgi:hypothetical protein
VIRRRGRVVLDDELYRAMAYCVLIGAFSRNVIRVRISHCGYQICHKWRISCSDLVKWDSYRKLRLAIRRDEKGIVIKDHRTQPDHDLVVLEPDQKLIPISDTQPRDLNNRLKIAFQVVLEHVLEIRVQLLQGYLEARLS